ncbi:hypothetical protein F5X96DRAFT_451599 [Biscogniauxia mediterranea]|nr:hypothetical protein F5X96DRAFT_451599 [Biscogniauxia mediterranea]
MTSNSLEESQDLREVCDNSTSYSMAGQPLVVNGSNSRLGSSSYTNSQSTVPIRPQYPNFDCSEYASTDPKSVQTRYGSGTGSAIPSTQRNKLAEASGYGYDPGYNLGPAVQQSSGQPVRIESSIRPYDNMDWTTFGQAVPMTMPCSYEGRYVAPPVMSGGYSSQQASAPAPLPKSRSEMQELQAFMAEMKGDLEETKRLVADVRGELVDILTSMNTHRRDDTLSITPTTGATNNATANDAIANDTSFDRLTEKFSKLFDSHILIIDELAAELRRRLRTA